MKGFRYRSQRQSLVCVSAGCSVTWCDCLYSGLSKATTQLCVNWMAPFVEAARCFGRATLRELSSVKSEDEHNFQTHADYMSMLVNIYLLYCIKAFELMCSSQDATLFLF